MKKVWSIFLFIMVFFVIAFCAGAKFVEKAQNEIVLKTLQGNVISSQYESKVVLRGTKQNSSPYINNVRIDIYDNEGNFVKTIEPVIDSGYSPDILLADFGVAPGYEQIFYGVNSGGSGGFGYFYVYSLDSGNVKTIFDFETFGQQNQFEGKYLDNYLVAVTKKDGGDVYLIDLRLRPRNYIDMVWDQNGKLITPREANVSGVNTVFPYYNYLTKNWQLMILQRVTGLYNADGLGYINTQQSWQDNGFKTFYQGMEIFPSNS